MCLIAAAGRQLASLTSLKELEEYLRLSPAEGGSQERPGSAERLLQEAGLVGGPDSGVQGIWRSWRTWLQIQAF